MIAEKYGCNILSKLTGQRCKTSGTGLFYLSICEIKIKDILEV
jgi:hypothetical protein